MIELIFVIVIIGILVGVAIPKFSTIIEDTNIQKGVSELSSIRSGINRLKQDNLLQGKNEYPDLNSSVTNLPFAGVTSAKIEANSINGWSEIVKNQKYRYRIGSRETIFTYDKTTGIFDCPLSEKFCKELNK